jgi:hypothetical protein
MKTFKIAAAAALLFTTAGVALANDNISSPGADYGQGYVERTAPNAVSPRARGGLYEGRTAYEGRGFVAPVPVPFFSTPADVGGISPANGQPEDPGYTNNN